MLFRSHALGRSQRHQLGQLAMAGQLEQFAHARDDAHFRVEYRLGIGVLGQPRSLRGERLLPHPTVRCSGSGERLATVRPWRHSPHLRRARLFRQLLGDAVDALSAVDFAHDVGG